ncbi:polysaccharide pyruvyl transferase family protein [Butyrivibrio sp. JL13D10]|uniref:polysaccharide pyruvyl transferase family protein n=1 Tax=Butyrivibrio sp. JL13D10 TaxID=3236815 RepID=UPI0038B4A6DA
MKKVAILTITNSGMNFGNRLQNYALQEAIKKCGAEVKTIRSAKSVRGSLFLSTIRRMIKTVVRNSKRRRIYSKFENSYIDYDSKIRYENINEEDFADKYDCFIAGSDQVWNPYFHFNSDFEFATFAPKEKRFSYAASIGVSNIDEAHLDRFTSNLKGMREISVREEDSVELVKKLTGITPQRHIDPTMLLEPEDYYLLEEKPEYEMPDKYLFMYYLGNIPDEYYKKVQEIADKKGLKIIKFTETPGEPFYNIGPQHFIYLIHHADYICTDSFHGTVFSLLFEKQFVIFTRQDKDVSMNSRIETLVDLFGIHNRLACYNSSDLFNDIDYVTIRNIVQINRNEAYEYLRSIIVGER